DLANFSADKLMFGQKLEAQSLRVVADNESYEIRGDVKVAGTPAQIEFRRLKGESDAEVKLSAQLDESARSRMGFDIGPALSGTVPMKLAGRVGIEDRGGGFKVRAGLN